MLRSYFGLSKNPFDLHAISLLSHQQEIFDTLGVHCQQGGFCLLLGQPGTGKSVIKSVLLGHDPKRLMLAPVARTLHSYSHTLRILCAAFQAETDGGDFKCEKRLLAQVHKLNQNGKMIVPLIDDAHLMNVDCLRKLRLLFEDFPKNHNLILTSNKAFADWSKVFADDPVMASAALDRLLHRSTVMNIRGESYRLKEKRRAGAAPDPGSTQEASAQKP